MTDRWINPNGFDDVPVMGREEWDFSLHERFPLTFHMEGFGDFQWDRKFRSDGGSVPPLVKGLPGYEHSRYARTYYGHDGIFRKGKVWLYLPAWRSNDTGIPDPDVTIREVPVSFAFGNAFLRRGIRSEGGPAARAWNIWAWVTVASWPIWLRYRRQDQAQA